MWCKGVMKEMGGGECEGCEGGGVEEVVDGRV